jgi:hypothetical protein
MARKRKTGEPKVELLPVETTEEGVKELTAAQAEAASGGRLELEPGTDDTSDPAHGACRRGCRRGCRRSCRR